MGLCVSCLRSFKSKPHFLTVFILVGFLNIDAALTAFIDAYFDYPTAQSILFDL